MTRHEIDILLFGSVAAGIFWRGTLTRAEWEKIHPSTNGAQSADRGQGS